MSTTEGSWCKLPAKFVLFGDSLTQQCFEESNGWGSLLAARYARRADILNRGFSGYNTKWALQLLSLSREEAFPKNPDVVTIFLGANDAQVPRPGNIQHISLDDYEAGLKRIVSNFKEIGAKNILLITPPPLNEDGWLSALAVRQGETPSESDRKNESVTRYAEKCRSIAAELKLPCVDLWNVFPTENNADLFTDGLHFSAKGHGLLYQELIKVIEEHLPEYAVTLPFNKVNSSSTSKLLPHGPFWDNINIATGVAEEDRNSKKPKLQ